MATDLTEIRHKLNHLEATVSSGTVLDREYSAVVGGFRKRRENLNDAIAWVEDRGGTVEVRFYVAGKGATEWLVLWSLEEG
jgi:hypothetical protein